MEQVNGGGIETYKEFVKETSGEYPEERKTELYLRFKKILFEKRNELLTESDKYMLVDFPINESNKENILTYRQELRDYPALSFFNNFNGDYGEGERLLPKINIS
jgi:hypothetical protein